MKVEREITGPPLPERAALGDWAIFLDLDGTLLDLAPRPDAVRVPEDLAESLDALRRSCDGAVAILSGRPLDTIDHFLRPLRLPAAAEHGAVLRRADGSIDPSDTAAIVPVAWRNAIRAMIGGWPGALMEEKPHGFAVHYRANPGLESEVSAALRQVAAADDDFEVLPATMAREIRHRMAHKGNALCRLMETAPFADRRPLFIGDDVTDEDAIRAAEQLGGRGLRVDEWFDGAPARVRGWLKELAGES